MLFGGGGAVKAKERKMIDKGEMKIKAVLGMRFFTTVRDPTPEEKVVLLVKNVRFQRYCG